MKGYTIQHSIELLEKQAGSGSGASTASDVSFDNTGTGLVSTDVQTALGEIVARSDISSTEKLIGTYNGDPLYAKTFEATLTANTQIVASQIYAGEVADLFPTDAKAPVQLHINSGIYFMGGGSYLTDGHWISTIVCLYAQISEAIKGFVMYTKAAPARSTRKKSSK